MAHRKKSVSKFSPVLVVFACIILIIGLFMPKKSQKPAVDASTPPPPADLTAGDDTRAPVQAPPDIEQLEQTARTYLADTFQLELASLRMNGGLEATISVPGVSDQEDQEQAPDNWADIQQSMISAQVRLPEALEMPDTSSILLVRDAGGKLILSVQKGHVSYDAYKPTPETPSNSGDSNAVYVWLPKTGDKYHTVSDCSGMVDPTRVTQEEAISRGFTRCDNCG